MKKYLFYDDITGESFIVEADCLADAMEVAGDFFEDPHFLEELDYLDAEMLGYDIY